MATKTSTKTQSTETAKPPVAKLRQGLLNASIWERTTENGAFYSVTFERRYRDSNGDWHSTHPTEKPVAVLLPLVETFCPASGLVVDPFAGSGSTLVAAKRLGRSYLGIELDAGYHAIATSRLDAALPTTNRPVPSHYGG